MRVRDNKPLSKIDGPIQQGRTQRGGGALSMPDMAALVGNQAMLAYLGRQSEQSTLPTTGETLPAPVAQLQKKTYLGADEKERKMLVPNRLISTGRVPTDIAKKLTAESVGLNDEFLSELKKAILDFCPENCKEKVGERLSSLSFNFVTADNMSNPDEEGRYSGIPARALTSEIRINVDSSDYYDADEKLKVGKVLSTVVHEALHYASANGQGFQSCPGLFTTLGTGTPSQDQPDEAMTDYLAYEVFHAMSDTVFPDGLQKEGGNRIYDTGYWVGSRTGRFSEPKNKTLEEKCAASSGELPTAWTGDMIPILQKALSHPDLTKLEQWYFSMPTELDKAFEKKTLRTPVADKWSQRKCEIAQKTHGWIENQPWSKKWG